jgi:hypothetical protein
MNAEKDEQLPEQDDEEGEFELNENLYLDDDNEEDVEM